jgi:hypothetical protein
MSGAASYAAAGICVLARRQGGITNRHPRPCRLCAQPAEELLTRLGKYQSDAKGAAVIAAFEKIPERTQSILVDEALGYSDPGEGGDE